MGGAKSTSSCDPPALNIINTRYPSILISQSSRRPTASLQSPFGYNIKKIAWDSLFWTYPVSWVEVISTILPIFRQDENQIPTYINSISIHCNTSIISRFFQQFTSTGQSSMGWIPYPEHGFKCCGSPSNIRSWNR